MSTSSPCDVGILAIEVYFPRRSVSINALETFDDVSKGKYTIGLGQEYMAFTDDREDINSIMLTVVQNLLEKYDIDPKSIGRLDVGTETLVDKSKSVKSVLMDLFPGNSDIEGIDSKNACYGGTAALFNAINWIESRSWDGRNAIVVSGDIAVYSKGAARAVGGAGACALLIGPNAPVVFEPIHGSYMANIYDFWKPNLESEFPEVDGPLTITAYYEALDQSYCRYLEKAHKAHQHDALFKSVNGIRDFDYSVLHSPYCKLVQKGYARLFYNDFCRDPSNPNFANIPHPSELLALPYQTSFSDKSIDRAFVPATEDVFNARVRPSLAIAKRCGNSYSGSLFGGIASLLSLIEPHQLLGKRVSLYGFGGGCAASFFALKVQKSPEKISRIMNLVKRLEDVRVASCEEYDMAMEVREKHHNTPNHTPQGSLDDIWPGSFYIKHIDDRRRRTYVRLPLDIVN